MSFKSQSAMEYLMTYGWAILIIAIVMVALFQLGVFNGTFFAPRATAGACEVYRSVDGVNLVGQCQGELPQFVAQFNNPIGAPWGESTSNIIIPGDPLLTSQSTPPFTITLWYNIQTHQTGTQYWDNMVSIQGYTGLEFVDQGG